MYQALLQGSELWHYMHSVCLFVCLFFCLDDLPTKGTLQTLTMGICTRLATTILSHTNIVFNIYDYDIALINKS